jgi:choline dehydrogenase
LGQFPDDWPDIEILPTSAYYGYQQNYLTQGPFDDYNYATLAFALNTPLSRGNLTISSANISDPPVINPNWLSNEIDQEIAVAFYRHIREIFASMGSEVLIGSEYFPGSALSVNASDSEVLQFIGESFNTLFHASCTCKMGPAIDSMTVVDSHARVVGVQNLRVVDISAFPLLPPGHPVATVCKYPLNCTLETILNDIPLTVFVLDALAEKIASDILNGQ